MTSAIGVRPCGRRVALCFLLVVVLEVIVCAAAAATERAVANTGAAAPFALPSVAAVLDVLGAPATASPLPAHPTLLLFTDASAETAGVATLRATVQQVAANLPTAVARIHTYAVPSTLQERRLVDLLLNNVAARLPALVLFHTSTRRAAIVPGALLSPLPLSPPVPFPHVDRHAALSEKELRTWLLSELPARYADPVTYHLLPSLHFVFHPAEARETVKLVRRAVEMQEGRSVLPEVVALAYTQLTTHGAEDVVAALSSLSAQMGNAALMLVTESPEVAAEWGLTEEHTLSTAPWGAVEAAYTQNITGSTTAVVRVHETAAPHRIDTVAALVQAMSAWSPAAAQRSHAAVTTQLRTWARAMDSFNTTSPLRKLDTTARVVHELAALQQAIKIVFVLRESDDLWFHHHLHVAATLAGRLQQPPLLFNTTTLTRQAKVSSRVLQSWTPTMRVEVFWIDAEQLPDVADALSVAQVPSVLVLAPLQSRYEEAGESGERNAEEATAAAAGLRSRDPLIGVHVVNRYDLSTATLTNDATVAMDPPSGKDALPVFPSDSDALIRFLASQSFLGALQVALHPVRLSQLRALTHLPENTASVPTTLPNRRYAQLDFRYYPVRAEEAPMEGPAYIRQILNGSTPLPLRTTTRTTRHGGATTTTTSAEGSNDVDDAARRAKEADAAAARKAQWEAELAVRRREKEARVQRKAAEAAAARETERAAFQASVDAAFRAEADEAEEAEAAAAAEATQGGGGGGVSGGARRGVVVRRPLHEAGVESAASAVHTSAFVGTEKEDVEDVVQRLRRRRLHAEYREWQADRARMVEACVSFSNGRELSLRFKWD